MPLRGCLAFLAPVILAVLAGCAGGGAERSLVSTADASALAPARGAAAAQVPVRDWPRFGYDAARSNSGPAAPGITSSTIAHLHRHVLHLPGTVDSSPIFLHSVRVSGRVRDVFFVTTTYGKTIALGAQSGHRLWQYTPPSAARLTGTSQITTTSPVADPDRHYIYAASPDGRIRKLRISDGHELRHTGHWPAVITRDATHEKMASALNLAGAYVYATTGGYIGDAPPYQGHVVAIGRRDGRVVGVFNSLCSNRRAIITPSSCGSSDSAIWARAGAIVEPGSGRIITATGNGPFNGRTDWGDSVVELAPRSLGLLQNYTPSDQASLEASDGDLGSTAPALLPAPGSDTRPRYAVQGGKDGVVRLLSLHRLNNRTGHAGGLKGGELQRITDHEIRFTAPAVLKGSGHVFMFTTGGRGTEAYELRGSPARLHLLWSNGRSGSSPVLAGGLLFVYDIENGGLNVYRPDSPQPIATLASGGGHWNSPVIVGNRIMLPEGSANEHSGTGVVDLYGP